MEPRRATEIPQCPICGFNMKWWFAKWKCFNCGQWNGCCGDSTSDPGGLWCEPKVNSMIILKELNTSEGSEVFEMIKEIGAGENGFVNSLLVDNQEKFQELLLKNVQTAQGINLPPNYVPQTIYWLYEDDRPVGYGKLRHYLNEFLLEHGGHIGYVIRPSERNKGYGKNMLSQLLREAKIKKIAQVLLTCDEINLPSRKIIEQNKGQLAEIKNGICKYWIET